MPLLIILTFLIVVAGVILISTQESTIKKLNKLNNQQQNELVTIKRAQSDTMLQLERYLKENPLDAYKLLTEHVSRARKFNKR